MTENLNETQSKVIEIVAKALKIDESKITLESNFVEDLGADSLSQVEIVMAIEAEFKIDISDEEASKISNISQAVECIEKKK